MQLTHTVPPEQLFRDYLYFSSFSDTMLTHAQEIVERVIKERGLGADSLVVEVASNDGYLLQYYQQQGVPVLGVEPAINIAKVAREQRGIRTLTEFFGAELAQHLRQDGSAADVIHANNVLAHVPMLNDFVEGFRILLKPNGVAIFEVPYVRELIERCEFDTIYHEHLCYFSLTALDGLFRRHALQIVDVERIAIHGGSLRLFVNHAGHPAAASVERLLAEERAWGVAKYAVYAQFSDRVEALTHSLRGTIEQLRRDGKRIAAYGAAAKGSTLLNYAGLGRSDIAYVADRSTYKQGRFMPGVHVPVVPPERLLTDAPDYVLLLAWNFADEIMQQQQAFRARGGRFIIPLPSVQIV